MNQQTDNDADGGLRTTGLFEGRITNNTMKYEGKLYGRIGSKTFDTGKTSIEWDALEADKRRLDWLADPENAIGNVQLPCGAVMENIGSLRDAIDAAMSGDYERNMPIVEPGYSRENAKKSLPDAEL